MQDNVQELMGGSQMQDNVQELMGGTRMQDNVQVFFWRAYSP